MLGQQGKARAPGAHLENVRQICVPLRLGLQMSTSKKVILVAVASTLLIIFVIASLTTFTYIYTTSQLAINKASSGVYENPEEGMRALMERSSYDAQDIVIIHAGPNSFDGSSPHIWYVVADIRPYVNEEGFRIGGSGHGAGSFFLHSKDGWVHVPEGAFPEVVGFGMKLFGLIPDNSK